MNDILFYNDNCLGTISKLENGSIDLVFTSPPYYNARKYIQYNNVEHYMSETKNIFSNILRVLKPNRMCVVNISPVLVAREKRSEQSHRIPLPFYFVPMMENIGYEFLEDIIWKKPDSSVPNRNGGFFNHRKPVAYKPNIVTEYILVFKKKSEFLIDGVLQNNSLVPDGYERTNVWEIKPETKSWHSAPFPQKLAENVIRYYSYENDIVYDPFAGSGTTGIVSKKLNRKCIMSEISKKIFIKAINNTELKTNKIF